MASRKSVRTAAPSEREAEILRREIHALGDYAHVTVRCQRGHLVICADDDAPVARLTPLGRGNFGMSFHRHTGAWEKMPFVGDLPEQASTLVATLAPYLQRYDFSDTKSGSDH
jgi:antitoxin (DNA-binding transcriptional repressor) of toxin-antitoxin stability system